MCLICVFEADKVVAQERSTSTSYSEYVVIGMVIAINSDRCLIKIRESNLLGGLRRAVESHSVTQAAVLDGFRPGDRIKGVLSSADGNLHRMHRVRTYPFSERG